MNRRLKIFALCLFSRGHWVALIEPTVGGE
jgi:hypothetical protein